MARGRRAPLLPGRRTGACPAGRVTPRPGGNLQSGASIWRDPGMCRIPGHSGISPVRDSSRSRKLALCGPMRDIVARSALIVRFRPHPRGRWRSGSGPPGGHPLERSGGPRLSGHAQPRPHPARNPCCHQGGRFSPVFRKKNREGTDDPVANPPLPKHTDPKTILDTPPRNGSVRSSGGVTKGGPLW
jgi:hypothetical protein